MENRTQGREGRVLYVYDRVCPKESKKRELYHRYGVNRQASTSDLGRANFGRPVGSGTGPRTAGDRLNRGASDKYAKNAQRPRANTAQRPRASTAQRPRASTAQRPRVNYDRNRAQFDETRVHNAWRPSSGASSSHGRRGGANSRVYNYRPTNPGYGGEAVAKSHFKLALDKILNLFESIEERGRQDEFIAKRQAIARKRLYEHRHTIGTALLLILIAFAFMFLVYKTFFVISDINANDVLRYTSENVITASGIHEGDNLYSFGSSDAEERITFYCPYIKSAEITRTVPNSVSISVTEDTAMYVSDIFGERVILSAGLRVLGVAGKGDDIGLTELILPPVEYSVAGRVIVFENEKNDRFIREVLSSVVKDTFFEESSIDLIDFSNGHDIKMTVDSKYILRLGSDSDCAVKLRMAEKMMTDPSFDRTKPAYIDLAKVGQASVRYDPKLFAS